MGVVVVWQGRQRQRWQPVAAKESTAQHRACEQAWEAVRFSAPRATERGLGRAGDSLTGQHHLRAGRPGCFTGPRAELWLRVGERESGSVAECALYLARRLCNSGCWGKPGTRCPYLSCLPARIAAPRKDIALHLSPGLPKANRCTRAR